MAATAASACIKTEVIAAEEGLKTAAQNKGLIYGCAVGGPLLENDPAFADAVIRDAGMLVHEYEMKRKYTQPRPRGYDFSKADRVMEFAKRHSMKTRGHPLVWHAANPEWLIEALGERRPRIEKERLLTEYIGIVGRRYSGRLHSWDVVNEAVNHEEWRGDGMRATSPWYKVFGESYIELAFHAAKEADPNAILFLNDFGVESTVRWNEQRRTAILKLLDRLKAKNVPVEGFGIQGHLYAYNDRFEEDVFANFLRQLEGYGLKLMITELDVRDRGGPPSPAQRDADIAGLTRRFLDVALESRAMLGVLTWGLSDRYSWVSAEPENKWPDGKPARILPLDENLAKKPMWSAIKTAFEQAPAR